MKRVSIQALKAGLAAAVSDAAAGETVVITRHNKPVARLGPARDDSVHVGGAVGTDRLRSALSRATKGRYLAVLADDRHTR